MGRTGRPPVIEAASPAPVRLSPWHSGRPWGGGRFGSVAGLPVGELWVSGDDATLPDGRTLAAVGLALAVPLVKILDIAGTLSVQVHPDDATARAVNGAGAVGKHECWVVLEAGSGASLAVGLRPGASLDDLLEGDDRRIEAALQARPVAPGTVIDLPPGTVHAPAGSLLIYEVQQRSDLTYRIWDWGRPRPLHLAAARRAIRPDREPLVGTLSTDPGLTAAGAPGAPFRLLSCVAGALGLIDLAIDRPGVLSVIEGSLRIVADRGAGSGDAAPFEAGSHWLLPPGRWHLSGPGRALLATW